MAAPLILSVDLRTINDWARDIILNKNLIAINQDPLGQMGRRIVKVDGNVEIWSKPLMDDRTAVSFVFYISICIVLLFFSLLLSFLNHMELQFM